MRWGWKALILGALALLAAGLSGPAGGGAAGSNSPSSLDDLFQLFGVATIPADVVVVVDTSGSMSFGENPPYPYVLEAFDSLVDALPEGDNLSVITFDASPTIAFQGALGADRSSARSALPPIAEGAGTDIGASLEATLQRLNRADASQVQLVIFLTDGQHEPALGSAFPTTSGERWDRLRVEADQIAEVRNLQVLGFSLGGLGAGGMDLLRNVFGNPVINAQPPEQLPEFFREAVRRTQLARLASEIEDDIERGITVQPAGSGVLAPVMEIDVPVRSNLEVLEATVTVEDVSVTLDGATPLEAEIVSEPRIVLPPGGESLVKVRVEAPVGDTGFRVPPETEEREVSLAVVASFTPEPVELLSEAVAPALGAPQPVDGTYEYTGIRTFGWTIPQLLLALAGFVVALLILYWLWKRFLQLPDLVGGFEVRRGGEMAFIPLKGKRHTLSARDIPNAGPAEIELYTRRGKPKRVYVRVERPQFTSLAGRRPAPITSDREIRAGAYRLGGGDLTYRPREGRTAATVAARAD